MANVIPDDAAGFADVLSAELEEIRQRREAVGMPTEGYGDELNGLALSGGGIRSATFCLGVLQELGRQGEAGRFDYLSTVSGGGYIGGWWSAWLSRPERTRPDGVFPGCRTAAGVSVSCEGIEPEREAVYRARVHGAGMPDGSGSAGTDPIHHLRLFSNYLTPRKGSLSADTWRAVTVFGRNLLLTWLVLLPILLLAVMAGQLYFVSQPGEAGSLLRPQAVAVGTPGANAAEAAARHASVRARFRVAAPVPIGLAGVIVGLTIAWLLTGPSTMVGRVVGGVGLAIAGAAACWAVRALGRAPPESGFFLVLLESSGALLAAAVVALLAHGWGRVGPVAAQSGGVAGNRITRMQASAAVWFVAVVAVLAVAGFGEDLLWYLFDAESGSAIASAARRAGGWGALLLTAATSLFTVWSAAPRGGATPAKGPSAMARAVFALAPPLLLVVLSVGLSAGSRTLLRAATHGDVPEVLAADALRLRPPVLAACIMALLLAGYELLSDARDGRVAGGRRGAGRVILVASVAAAAMIALIAWRQIPARFGVPAALASMLWVFAVRWSAVRALRPRTAAIAGAFVALGFGVLLNRLPISTPPEVWNWFAPALAAILFGGIFALAELAVGRRSQRRALALVTGVFVTLSVLLVVSMLPPTPGLLRSSVLLSLMVAIAAWAIGLGWMADPNRVSLHAFYRARLTRAYLGASNDARNTAEITQSVAGDDVALAGLRNCERGGPYHLVNATLNLVGGHDLATGQRAAESFLFSKLHCGSLRTGFRPTSAYVGGTLHLGTAVAVSGAAASPNMGTHTPSAALAMLLALFDVRLGYWAPTPNRQRWRETQARLWPFYVLREFLSQTTDLSSFCFLSDGGHFENTALYSLVARGCRTIVVVDCGADPATSFEDIGTVIRRCRIDFGTEIELKVDTFLPVRGAVASAHFVAGEITYSEAHLAWLRRARQRVPGASAGRESSRGTVFWIKPALTCVDESADVRQYQLSNRVFPQQSTADQWFDEAQFESYRRLGELSARALLSSDEWAAMGRTAGVG